ncbi:MAG: S-methyl-5-thioribose-1-phosphate isomerase [Candidatus Coatesbacteria bacterium RBG_13_66_14]|uniref:Methylthioribose-1-phosphate isomerase n=1 Tax=Candidatus Coatesbacteria bacterium RBG_13_66_14 TaxID=1817816 RepID=A0A1F5FAT4_9BACT|nr:MAG: S-methyl-5-thioribose-1-phosphate isomerase [Candidatus Coatesbacteria bacterium RBG_13_66_14]
MPVKTIAWENNSLVILDQTLLPTEERYAVLETVEDVHRAILRLEVRGAPAIGAAAALGLYVAVQHGAFPTYDSLKNALRQAADFLASSRPTAVNLTWALERMTEVAEGMPGAEPEAVKRALLDEALAIMAEDREACRAIGRHGQGLLADGSRILTHCNAGGLATVDYGTALGVVYAALEAGKKIRVYADETRPLLQGARLTAWELQKSGVPVTLICDGMAAAVMARGLVDCVITGADRIAANGDTANKIGTYGLAVLAREHGLPFYVAAPLSSFDLGQPSGDKIPIEERDPDEVRLFRGVRTAPPGVDVFNPAFDLTPHRYVTAFVTERGIIRPPFAETLKGLSDR